VTGDGVLPSQMAIEEQALATHIKHRLEVIQSRHNFNPQVNGQQVAHLPEVAKAYGEFQTLLRLVEVFHLQAYVGDPPYDPAGLNPTKRHVARKARPVHVYFARKDGTTYWKIGSSLEPLNRIKAVQTGNDGTIRVRYVVPGGGKVLETRLKRILRRWKTRDRGSSQKGEWFDLTPVYVKSLVTQLRGGAEEIPLPSN
jgi:hypothetical protein